MWSLLHSGFTCDTVLCSRQAEFLTSFSTKIYFLSFLLIFTHMTLLTFLRALENKIQRSEIQFPMEDLYFSLSHTNDIFLYLTTRLKINYPSHFI